MRRRARNYKGTEAVTVRDPRRWRGGSAVVVYGSLLQRRHEVGVTTFNGFGKESKKKASQTLMRQIGRAMDRRCAYQSLYQIRGLTRCYVYD